MNPSLHQIRALLDAIQPDIATAIIDRLNGHPRAQAYDSDRTTNGDGPSDPTANAAITPDQARADLAKLEAAVVRAYTSLLCVAALSDRYQPAHAIPRKRLAAETKGCTLHIRAGVEEHRQAYRTTDLADVLDTALKEPLPVCRWCYDFPRRLHPTTGVPLGRIPTNEEIRVYERTGRVRLHAKRVA